MDGTDRSIADRRGTKSRFRRREYCGSSGHVRDVVKCAFMTAARAVAGVEGCGCKSWNAKLGVLGGAQGVSRRFRLSRLWRNPMLECRGYQLAMTLRIPTTICSNSRCEKTNGRGNEAGE